MDKHYTIEVEVNRCNDTSYTARVEVCWIAGRATSAVLIIITIIIGIGSNTCYRINLCTKCKLYNYNERQHHVLFYFIQCTKSKCRKSYVYVINTYRRNDTYSNTTSPCFVASMYVYNTMEVTIIRHTRYIYTAYSTINLASSSVTYE